MIGIRAHRQKVTGDEPDAKAILHESRSVQKANSYQFYLDGDTVFDQRSDTGSVAVTE